MTAIKLARLDHFVLTVKDVEASCAFYTRVLGMEVVRFGAGRTALRYGDQKINLHPVDNTIAIKARHPVCGSADVCFIADTPLPDVVAHLRACGVAIEEGPSERTGALGAILSVYIRDPDGNLVEVSNYGER